MIADAELEFTHLATLTPHSELPKNLLRRVASMLTKQR